MFIIILENFFDEESIGILLFFLICAIYYNEETKMIYW